MSGVIDFYKATLTSLGLITDEEGFIKVDNGDGTSIVLPIDGKSSVLPTKEHIATLFTEGEDGMEVTKHLFNPLDENAVKGDSKSFTKIKDIAAIKIAFGIQTCGRLLLTLATNPDLQKKVSIQISKFLTSLSSAKKQNMKEIVDEKMIETWDNLFKKYATTEKGIASIVSRKSAMYNGVKYNRLATFKHNLYEELLEIDQDTPICGIKLRTKDITVFKLVYEYILDTMNSEHVISVGSTDGYAPAFISLMELYTGIMTRLNAINRTLAHIDQEAADQAYIELTLTEEDIKGVGMYAAELKTIPSGLDIERTLHKPKPSVIPTATPQPTAVQQVQPQPQQQVVQQPIPAPYTAGQSISNEDRLLNTIRANAPQLPVGYAGYANYASQVQQPMMQMQPMMQAPMGQMPMQQPMMQMPQPQQTFGGFANYQAMMRRPW